jgi:hypothetical protein
MCSPVVHHTVRGIGVARPRLVRTARKRLGRRARTYSTEAPGVRVNTGARSERTARTARGTLR